MVHSDSSIVKLTFLILEYYGDRRERENVNNYNELFSTDFKKDKKEAFIKLKQEKQQQIEQIKNEIIEKREKIGKLLAEYEISTRIPSSNKAQQLDTQITIEQAAFPNYVQKKMIELRNLNAEIDYIDTT